MQLSFENLYKDKFQKKIKIYQTNLIWKKYLFIRIKKVLKPLLKKGSTPLIVVIIAFNVQRRHLKVNLEKEYGIQINEDNDERKLK